MTDHTFNIRAFIEHAARFELAAKSIESDLNEALHAQRAYYRRALRPLVDKRKQIGRLRRLSDDAQHQVEILRKLDGEDTSIRRTGDLIAEEISRQECLALVNVKAS